MTLSFGFTAQIGDGTIAGSIDALTPREQQVLAMIGRGLSIPQIADKLFRSQKTIETHRQSLGRKLGVSNRVQLARIAIEMGLAPLARGSRAAHDDADPAPSAVDAAVSAVNAACASVIDEPYCRALTQSLAQTLDTAGAAVYLVDEIRHTCRMLALFHRGAHLKNQTGPAASSPCLRVLDHGRFLCEYHVARDFAGWTPPIPQPIHSYLGLRLDAPRSRTPVGLVFLFHDEPRPFSPLAQPTLDQLAPRAAAELDRIQLIDHLQHQLHAQPAP